jgi:pyruvate dehydrogenase E1 component alpha subunit
MNLAAIWDLPVIFVLENNQYAVSTPIRDSARVEHLSSRAAGYGMPGVTVDGNDAAVVYGAMQEPLRRARAGEGPSLLECMTFRHGGHHVNDPGLYLPAEQLAHWKERDPLVLLRARLARAGVAEAEVDAIDERVEALMDEAVEFATESPNPSIDAFRAEVAAAEAPFIH